MRQQGELRNAGFLAHRKACRARDRWDTDALRDMVRQYIIEYLADDDAVLVVDETGFLKQGKSSCGVARQYTGSAGKSRTAGSACSLPMCRASGTLSSIERSNSDR